MRQPKRPAWPAPGADSHAAGAESSEEELVAGLRRGTRDAFAGLHERYAGGIYSLAMRMVRHAPDAEDITHDVLIRAYERVPRERSVMLRPWLYRLTLNRCYDHLRAAARRRPAVPVADHEAAFSADPFEQAELRRLFEAALYSLTRRQRAAMLLKDVHGLSIAEVAAAMGITPGSVEVQLARARRAFRASFEELCRVEGREPPHRSAPSLAAMLPMLPLPPALQAPPALLAPAPVGLAPLTLTTGGIGAAFGAPAALKTAAIVLAATAAVTTAGLVASPAGPPGGERPAAVAASSGGAGFPRAATPSATPTPATAHAHALSASPSPAATYVDASPSFSASPAATTAAALSAGPLGEASPEATPETEASPSTSPSASPTPTPTASPSPSPSPSAQAPSPTSSASPGAVTP